MLFFLMGIVTTMVFQPTLEEEYSSFANYDVPSELFESMIIYQALYSRKTVEEASRLPSDTQRLVKEFNVENNTEMRVPDLSSQGYEFRRVQQLAFPWFCKTRRILLSGSSM